MTRILAVSYAAGDYLPGQPAVHSLDRRPPAHGRSPSPVSHTVTRDDLERLVDVVTSDPDTRGVVVAIMPAWHSDPLLHRRLQTVRAVLDSMRIVVYVSPLPPLAGSVLCALATAVAPYVESPGLLVAGLPFLERQLLPVALLRSVARLRHPAPSRRQRLASWWPPRAFGVSWWPQPGVHTLGRHDQVIGLPPPTEWQNIRLTKLAVASAGRWPTASLHAAGGAAAWARHAVAAPLAVFDVLERDPVPLASRYWGTAGLVEAVAYPSNVGAMVSGVGYRRRALHCRWCGELVVSATCPFCRTDRALTREAV